MQAADEGGPLLRWIVLLAVASAFAALAFRLAGALLAPVKSPLSRVWAPAGSFQYEP